MDTMKSLDEIDRESFHAGPSPLDMRGREMALAPCTPPQPAPCEALPLNGVWRLAMEGDDRERLAGGWEDAIDAPVPGSVHTALFEAGVIPDPIVGDNQVIARQYSYHTWWMMREFDCGFSHGPARLEFDGVANKCEVWLNGEAIAAHEGMFGGPFVDVTGKLKEKNNILIVKLYPIPFVYDTMMRAHDGCNESWKDTVVINNVYGWHYSTLPSLGLWNEVRLVPAPPCELSHPFAFVRDLERGQVGVQVGFDCRIPAYQGELRVSMTPMNFEGPGFGFEETVCLHPGDDPLRYEIAMPQRRLWWPNDMGEQNLYRFRAELVQDGRVTSAYERPFGFRTVEMEPLPCGPRPDKANWTFVVNGKKMFVKGTGWCTMDAMLDFSQQRYERFLSMARDQHIQMVRAWGCGLPEKDIFYELCDRYGIMVMQEWPTAWDSHKRQPYEMLRETVHFHTLRLRNHPSLILYGGGNESGDPYGEAMDMMGRASIELDGTRAFHRGEPYGGSQHNYNVYWDKMHMDHNLSLEADFWGEFGLASQPNLESVMRYTAPEDQKAWPFEQSKSFVYHTPVFGNWDDVNNQRQYAQYFTHPHYAMGEFITGSQLAQAFGVRPVLERSRARFPLCTGALYYKLNDNFPAASWSTVDWFGAPKLSYYVIQDAFMPLHACILFNRTQFDGTPQNLPVFLMDDADALEGREWKVNVRVYDGELQLVHTQQFSGNGSIKAPLQVGELSLSLRQTACCPLLTVCEVEADGEVADRSFYASNYESRRGCLFELPRAGLVCTGEGNTVTVACTGDVPAVGVTVKSPHPETFTAQDNFFWLEAGESRSIQVSDALGVWAEALNSI